MSGFIAALAPPRGVAVYNGNSLTDVAAFNTWLGKTANIQLVSFDQSSWANFLSGIPFETSTFNGYACQWSVPLCCAFGDLPDVIAGVHDTTFIACADAILAAVPYGAIWIRAGWEFNLLDQGKPVLTGFHGISSLTKNMSQSQTSGQSRKATNKPHHGPSMRRDNMKAVSAPMTK